MNLLGVSGLFKKNYAMDYDKDLVLMGDNNNNTRHPNINNDLINL
jgi:hypothetical protein